MVTVTDLISLSKCQVLVSGLGRLLRRPPVPCDWLIFSQEMSIVSIWSGSTITPSSDLWVGGGGQQAELQDIKVCLRLSLSLSLLFLSTLLSASAACHLFAHSTRYGGPNGSTDFGRGRIHLW